MSLQKAVQNWEAVKQTLGVPAKKSNPPSPCDYDFVVCKAGRVTEMCVCARALTFF